MTLFSLVCSNVVVWFSTTFVAVCSGFFFNRLPLFYDITNYLFVWSVFFFLCRIFVFNLFFTRGEHSRNSSSSSDAKRCYVSYVSSSTCFVLISPHLFTFPRPPPKSRVAAVAVAVAAADAMTTALPVPRQRQRAAAVLWTTGLAVVGWRRRSRTRCKRLGRRCLRHDERWRQWMPGRACWRRAAGGLTWTPPLRVVMPASGRCKSGSSGSSRNNSRNSSSIRLQRNFWRY